MRALRRASSACVGWLADRSVPRPLRRKAYGLYCRLTGADLGEAELSPEGYPSLGAFFVRRLKPGLRPLDPDPLVWGCPCDGRLQALERVEAGLLLQAKGQRYPLAELLAGAFDSRALEGAWTFTLYLSPRDYHRVHAPVESRLLAVRWIPGERRSVAPEVLARRERLLATNERAVLRLESAAGAYPLVMIGALNVGRIRVVGVAPGATPEPGREPVLARGAELARFELGSTVVLVTPPGLVPVPGLAPGAVLRLHQPLARRPS
jgi:phosphatidylserine decarboxylase